jgi:hypothetical protein
MNQATQRKIDLYKEALDAYRSGSRDRRASVLALLQECRREEALDLKELTRAGNAVQRALFGNVEDSDLVPGRAYDDIRLDDDLPNGDVSDQIDALKTLIKEAEEGE